ncbi:hypothetical protein GCM10027589_48000 [Actinocorallia lasiicapitis]
MTVTAPSARTVLMHGREFEIGDMCWRRAFPGLPAEARRAREFVGFLTEGFACVDDVLLAAAEMISNAVRHTRSGLPGGLFVVEVRRWRGGAALTVIDQGGPSEPRAKPLAESADEFALFESGRGLLTIGITASWWDWTGGDAGRTVTAVFHAPSIPAP